MKSIMNRELQQMKDVASGIVKGILASTPKADVAFKRMIPLQEGEVSSTLSYWFSIICRCHLV